MPIVYPRQMENGARATPLSQKSCRYAVVRKSTAPNIVYTPQEEFKFGERSLNIKSRHHARWESYDTLTPPKGLSRPNMNAEQAAVAPKDRLSWRRENSDTASASKHGASKWSGNQSASKSCGNSNVLCLTFQRDKKLNSSNKYNQSVIKVPETFRTGSTITRSFERLEKSLPSSKKKQVNGTSERLGDGGYKSMRLLNELLVIKAVQSLYADRIRPFLADVLQRVKAQMKIQLQETHKGVEAEKASDNIDVLCLHEFIMSNCTDIIQLVPFRTNGDLSLTDSPKIPMCTNSTTPNQVGQMQAMLMKSPGKSDNEQGYQSLSEKLILKIRTQSRNLSVCAEAFSGWVDPHDNHNPFSVDVWRSLWAFLLCRLSSTRLQVSPTSDLMPYQFKGGRYGLASDLKQSEFPILRSMALGELCHLVQLCIKAGILAYERSVLQPTAACSHSSSTFLRLGLHGVTEEKQKATEAMQKNDRKVFESLSDLSTCVGELLEERPDGLVVAQLKKLLIGKFHKELIPERFGFRKLTECLTMCPRLRNVCQVVCPDPSSHRLLLMHQKFVKKDSRNLLVNRTPVFEKSTPMMGSPGSLSTAAGSDTSLCKSPDSIRVSPEQPSDPVIPFNSINRIASSVRPLTFFAWAFNPSIGPKQFPVVAPVSMDSSLAEDTDILDVAMETVLNGLLAADRDPPELEIPAGSIYESYWDCFQNFYNDSMG